MCLNYHIFAETMRVCKVLPFKYHLIKNLLLSGSLNQWKIIYLSHSATTKNRLSDEDLREIYFLLTDLYPEEVEQNPNPIKLLSELSNAKKTVAIVDRVYEITKNVLEKCEDNEQRANIIRPVFSRIDSPDLVCFFERLSNREGTIKYHDVSKALAHANGELLRHVKKASYLIGMEKVCDRLARQESIHDVLKPAIGRPLIIPSPTIAKVEDIPFGRSFLEIPEGDRMTLHILDDDDFKLFNTTGEEHQVEEELTNMIQDMKKGIYLIEYASGRDVEIMFVDLLTPSVETMPFSQRRKEIGCPDWLLKPMTEIEDASYYLEKVGSKQPVVVWNANGILTYESSMFETVLLNMVHAQKFVFMVVGGVYVKETPQSRPKLSKWRIAVRDGDSHYSVGLVDIDPTLSLMRFVNPHKVAEGEEVSMNSPVFVNVKVISSGWGDYGAYVQGVITSVASQSGLTDCVSINEIEVLTKRWDEYYGGND